MAKTKTGPKTGPKTGLKTGPKTGTVLANIAKIKALLLLIERKVISGYSLLALEKATVNNCKLIKNEKDIESRQHLGEARETCIENLGLIVKKLYAYELRQKFSKVVRKIVKMGRTAKNFRVDPNDLNSALDMRVEYLARNGRFNILQRVNSCSIETLADACNSSLENQQLDFPLFEGITPPASAQASPRNLVSAQASPIFTDEEISFILNFLF